MIAGFSKHIMLHFGGSDSLHFENSEMTHPYYFFMGYGNGKQECRRLADIHSLGFFFPRALECSTTSPLEKRKKDERGTGQLKLENSEDLPALASVVLYPFFPEAIILTYHAK